MDEVDTDDHPVLLFDGVCNLCNGFVHFIIRHDPDATFRFAPLQSDVTEELLTACGDVGDDLDTVVLVEGNTCYTKSMAVLRVARRLGWPYRLLYPFRVVPRWLRDAAYDFVADHRYGWFGRRDQCMVPTPDVTERFLVEPTAEPTA